MATTFVQTLAGRNADAQRIADTSITDLITHIEFYPGFVNTALYADNDSTNDTIPASFANRIIYRVPQVGDLPGNHPPRLHVSKFSDNPIVNFVLRDGRFGGSNQYNAGTAIIWVNGTFGGNPQDTTPQITSNGEAYAVYSDSTQVGVSNPVYPIVKALNGGLSFLTELQIVSGTGLTYLVASGPIATQNDFGWSRKATDAEVSAGTAVNRYVTPDQLASRTSAFDLHDDISNKVTTITNSYRFLTSQEDAIGDPNAYIEGEDLRKEMRSDLTTLTDGANIAWNAEDKPLTTVTLAGNRTLNNPTNVKNGGLYILLVQQDNNNTARTLTYQDTYRFETVGGAPTLSTTAGAIDVLRFIYVGGKMRCVGVDLDI